MWVNRSGGERKRCSGQFRETKKCPAASGRVRRQIFLGLTPMQRHLTQHLSQIRRLIASVLRFRSQGAWQQIRRVTLEHQPPALDLLDQRMQMRASALVTDPAGNADVQIQVEIAE